MTTTITTLYKRMRQPYNRSLPEIQNYFVLGDSLQFIKKSTGKIMCVFEPGNVKFYQSDGATVLLEVDETTGVTVNGGKIKTSITGTATFNSSTGVIVPIGVTIPLSAYDVKITVEKDVEGYIGDISVEWTSESTFTVYCSGGSTTATFRWEVTY